VPDGQWLMIGGHNGSGKTSLLKAIAGLIPPTSGSVFVGGQDLMAMPVPQRSRRLFYLEQNPTAATAGCLSVYETLMLADAARVKWRDASRIGSYMDMLAEVDLQARMHHPVDALSGGERQLLSILVARLRGVELLLLDEPTSALDDKKVHGFLRSLEYLSQKGCSILMVSHSLTQLETLGSRTVLLRDGAVVLDEEAGRSAEAIKSVIAGSIQEW
jgi:putative ABC transport system ATP-binding protein